MENLVVTLPKRKQICTLRFSSAIRAIVALVEFVNVRNFGSLVSECFCEFKEKFFLSGRFIIHKTRHC